MLLRKETEIEADAVVAFMEKDGFGALSAQLDEALGLDNWVAAGIGDGAGAVHDVATGGGRFLIIGVTSEREAEISAARELIGEAKLSGLKVILLAESLSPSAMHGLMRAGADDFAPLPLPTSALAESIGRLGVDVSAPLSGGLSRAGLVYSVYGAAGGVGATTFAVNLAWETALETARAGKQVALLDFNFQYGSVATYLDLPRREAIYDLLSDSSTLDEEGFGQALATYAGRMAVLTAPMDVLPLDIVGPEDVATIIALARTNYDFIFIDLPQTLTHWSDLVLTESEAFFAVMRTDMRSAQNMLRFLRAVKSEDLPIEKVTACLSRAPAFTDMSGRSRVRKLQGSLGVDFEVRLPDGGRQVVVACDQGEPLARSAKGNALRKEIRKVARGLVKSAAEARKHARAGG